MAKATTNRQSGRLAALEPKVFFDIRLKRKRLQKHLELLEKDNMHDDPHANLTWHKAVPKFDDNIRPGKKRKSLAVEHGLPLDAGTKKGRKLRQELSKQRFRKNFSQLNEEYEKNKTATDPRRTYSEVIAQSSSHTFPRKFCSVCGFQSSYTCSKCGSYFCSVPCNDSHMDTRCMKWMG